MGIDNYKFTEADFDNQGLTNLPDRPNEAGFSATQLKARFDNIPKIIMALGKLNGLMNFLASTDAAADIGATPVKEGGSDKIQEILSELQAENAENTTKRHTHANKTALDEITDTVKAEYDRLTTLLTGITDISTTLENDPQKIPTSKAVLDAIYFAGGGDMLKAFYDANNDGIVDDSERLGGKLPGHYTAQTIPEILYANLWAGAEAPYIYTLSVDMATSTSFNAVLPEISPLDSGYTAYQSADLADGGQSDGIITILARGTKPASDIPVRVTIIH